MFLVYGSDSLGPAGRDEAVRWVREALAEQPDGARAGVALFGGDARMELTVLRAQTATVDVGPIVELAVRLGCGGAPTW